MSSTRAPFRRRLTATQSGLDPLTHYWFKAGKDDYRRLCDDDPWVKGLRYERPPGIECVVCTALRDDDRRHGWGVFFLTYALQGILAPSPEDVIYVPDDGLSTDGGDTVKQPTMPVFADFYVAGDTGRETIVKNFKNGEGFNYYGPLTALVRRYLRSGDIEGLRSARVNLNPTDERGVKRAADLESVKLDLLELWTSRPAEYFEVPTVGVSVGDLTIKVAPEVGMRTADGERALRLWYNPTPMEPRRARVYHYLLTEASKNLRWSQFEARVWDVRRKAIPIPPFLPDTMAYTVEDAAVDFIRLLDSP